MAIRIANKNPLEIQKRNGIGIFLPLNGPAIFKSTYTTKDTIKFNLINFILTNKNERVFNSDFGGNLRAQLFSQIQENNIEGLRENLDEQIRINFPNVQILELIVSSNADQNQLKVLLKYNIINGGVTDNIELTFN
jgi:phage baseplate assembly protein W